MRSVLATRIDEAALRAWPLPPPDHDGDKESRGRALIVAGTAELAGAAVLAGMAALRAGAGKLTVATCESAAGWVAQSLPEARVIGLAQAKQGGFDPGGIDALAELADKVDAILIGPGMQNLASTADFTAALWRAFGHKPVILDAAAMDAISAVDGRMPPPLVTPHAGEMAHLTGASKQAVLTDPATAARDAARRFNAVVVLKGPATFIASPQGELWRHEGGNAGLATSGSGDVLAGLLVALVARGATLVQAAAWGVALHARAGDRLARRLGTLGYLARELPAEVPALMEFLAAG